MLRRYFFKQKCPACLLEAAPRGQAHQVAVHQAWVGLPLFDAPQRLKSDGQLEATGIREGLVEPDQLDLAVDLHVSFVKLTLQQTLDALQKDVEFYL